ncbi:cytochrome b/b6 domain-containing protein [Oxynema sp. CENA135]|uniref:cytochrome b/b6 domain-containing protein n=1 Tax=Oxynema sp. CENA135 TaxID=984206 RepID=UPI00190AA006|nr:cytochrome b/b6 domain-containing protein [Oxynema sp. CENA135]MBK4729140.1 cytochrome b/b6 domain-containing protein [Oxynema sp. CENA135]
MSERSRPYQPSLLRLLHAANALVVLCAWLSAILVYNTYDRRFVQLPLPEIPGSIDIHGTFAVGLLLTLPPFALYSFHLGSKRLIQSDSWRQLKHLDRPSGRYALHRIANTLILLATTVAFVSGRMMKEDWLPQGNLQELWYTIHLWGWIFVGIALILHIALGVWVGGIALMRSMVSWRMRENDTPQTWWQQVQRIWKP